MKIKTKPSINRLINNIDRVIENNRMTLPVNDVTALTNIRNELKTVKVGGEGINADLICAISDIAMKLIKYFLTDENNDWIHKLN